MKLLLNWLISAVAIIIAAFLLPGVSVSSFLIALVVAVVIAGINAFVKPLLVLLTLPLTFITFGLFLFVINALLIMFAAWVVPGFQVAGFWWALIFAVVLSIVNSAFYRFGKM